MFIGSEVHLLNHSLRTENEEEICQNHSRNIRIKCISFLWRKLACREVEGNGSLISHFEKKHTLTQALFSNILIFLSYGLINTSFALILVFEFEEVTCKNWRENSIPSPTM